MKDLYVVDPRIDIDADSVSTNNLWEAKRVCFEYLLKMYWEMVRITAERTNILWQLEYQVWLAWYDARSFSENPPKDKVYNQTVSWKDIVKTPTPHPNKPLNISEDNKRRKILEEAWMDPFADFDDEDANDLFDDDEE